MEDAPDERLQRIGFMGEIPLAVHMLIKTKQDFGTKLCTVYQIECTIIDSSLLYLHALWYCTLYFHGGGVVFPCVGIDQIASLFCFQVIIA